MTNGPYKRRITELAKGAARALLDQGISPAAVDFGAPPAPPGRRPGDARSEFLANRAMGDWAEGVVKRQIDAALTRYHAIKYGNADNIVAGDPAFPEFYAAYQDELRTTGKRPDLLLFPPGEAERAMGEDVSGWPREHLRALAPQAVAGIEVRSSKFYALRYAEARARELEHNPRARARAVQSFTPKLEDLRVVKRWIDAFGVRHFYVQVFFDAIYAISFENILRVIGEEPDNFSVEENRNNQEKPTIHIPVTLGVKLSEFTTPPEFRAETRLTRLFRLDAYVVPAGGEAPMQEPVLLRLFGL